MNDLENAVFSFILRNDLSCRTTHYRTHAAEIDVRFLNKAMILWEQMGCPEGDIEIPVEGFRGKTRLWGSKMGDTISPTEPTYIRKRGEGRPFQDRFICREEPLRETNIITVAIYDGGLETIYAGPALGPMPEAGEVNDDWENNYLAFTREELGEMESPSN